MAFKCPNCSITMVAESAHGVQLEVCPNCAGIWLSPDELRALLSGDPTVISELEESLHPQVDQQHLGGSHLLCPFDNVLMEQYHYLYNSPILIHTCSNCGGLFINGDELPQMKQWFEKGHQPLSKDEELRVSMATDIAQHEAFMAHQMHLQGMFNTLRRYRPGWSGLFP